MEKSRRDFIANVSHELRTPLTSIQGYTETLLDNPLEDNHVRDFLEIIRKNAARMSRLTEDLLTLARVESGEHRFDIQRVSTEELLQDALESFREVARSYGVELVIENAIPAAHVNADREAIHQILSNSTSEISDRAFPPSICTVFSSVSTAWIKPARGNPGALASDSPSPSILFWRMRERFVPRASLTTARPFCLPCQSPSRIFPSS
jgi:hypothetical protein